jgi:hypothetical protein
MKLKRTSTNDEIEVIGDDWVIVSCEPPEVWTDVTSEIEAKSNGHYTDGLYHNGIILGVRNYRLRKVQLYNRGGLDHGGMMAGETREAFIVERREGA